MSWKTVPQHFEAQYRYTGWSGTKTVQKMNALGKPVSLRAELKRGPVILTWYSGGWCPYCNLALAYLQRYLSLFQEAGAELIAITPEKPDDTLSTKEKHALEFEVLTDETNSVAKLYGGVHKLNKEVSIL